MVLLAFVSSVASCTLNDIKETDVVLVLSFAPANFEEAEIAIRRTGNVNEISGGQLWTGTEGGCRDAAERAMVRNYVPIHPGESALKENRAGLTNIFGNDSRQITGHK
ncbi:MAG: hypothetical protein OXR67_05040 [Chloroflexota bacterium]|nr:hypothetical protein [Chloroflexota bacterium]